MNSNHVRIEAQSLLRDEMTEFICRTTKSDGDLGSGFRLRAMDREY